MAPSSLPSRLPLSFCVLFAAVTTAACLPHSSQQLPHSPFSKRHDLISKFDNGTFFVPDPVTQQPLPQGSASDGGGSGFDAPAIIWLVWSFAVGGPLLLAGIRLSRVTTGFAIGTTCTLLGESRHCDFRTYSDHHLAAQCGRRSSTLSMQLASAIPY